MNPRKTSFGRELVAQRGEELLSLGSSEAKKPFIWKDSFGAPLSSRSTEIQDSLIGMLLFSSRTPICD